MSRSRNLKPGFFKNDLLAECHPLARILFQGLWCEADREGRLENRPARIKAECLPYDECDVIALLAQLAERGFIVLYVADGKRYIAIPEFAKHQNPHMKEAASTIPAPDLSGANSVPVTSEPSSSPADSLLLIPVSLKEEKHVRQAARFPEFWKAMPSRKGTSKPNKKGCLAKWRARDLDALADTILADIALRKKADSRWTEGFVPDPLTYLNQDRWDDDKPEAGAPAATVNTAGSSPAVVETAQTKHENHMAFLRANRSRYTPEQFADELQKATDRHRRNLEKADAR